MIKECWKPVVGFEGLYEVSSKGRVRSIERRGTKGKILKPAIHRKGYYQYALTKDSVIKWYKAHRLVAIAFIPNPHNLPCVNHKDEDKTNNFVWVNEDGTVNLEKSNLEWCDYHYNNTYGTRIERINKKMVKPILQYDLNGNLIKEWEGNRTLCREMGYNSGFISTACNKDKIAYGYRWKHKKAG